MDSLGVFTGSSMLAQGKVEKPLGDGTVKYDQPFIVFSDFDGYASPAFREMPVI